MVYITTEHGQISSVIFREDYFSSEDSETLAGKLIGHTADRKCYASASSDVDDISLYFSGQTKEKRLNLLI